MPLPRAAFLLGLLLAAAAAESVRETETMDARWLDNVGSGDLPDDEDIGEFTPHLTSDEFDIDDTSGSGDYSDYDDAIYLTTVDTPAISDNYIPGDTERKMEGEKKNTMLDNEIIPDKASPVEANLSNKISMASTANSSIFERTEVLTALIAGGAVGLLFAVFLILLLVYRMKKKDEGSYDLGKKPIYKKAPTNEFYA
ncbi:syndecan-4 precursor [Gallus gallus]|uniref:Syndecan-4 n=1 Tax=Gallus gallus TaxID=9031 RepID=SDC4_CHICK|nr:syndecan-4 precursor [Gallus gallus]P49416.1 RecName: Full=Syndecan-4; Flags: Precursor [Gallus gallus]AAA16479.1 heparan sulfate proteoglycan [Gallus gallus]|eukprot:NP_001007870.1 syndecan-4 precursor [Gallus gallus]